MKKKLMFLFCLLASFISCSDDKNDDPVEPKMPITDLRLPTVNPIAGDDVIIEGKGFAYDCRIQLKPEGTAEGVEVTIVEITDAGITFKVPAEVAGECIVILLQNGNSYELGKLTIDEIPEPEPITVTVSSFTKIRIANYCTGKGYIIDNFKYDTYGRVEEFKFNKGDGVDPGDQDINVRMDWGEWGSRQVVATFDKDGVSGQTCTATYTLNDKGWMEKVVVKQGSEKIEEYEAEYTETSFALYKVESSEKEKLYSASIAAGGNYGDWTVTEAAGAKVEVDYREFDIPEEIEGCRDVLLLHSYVGWLMPECVVWAHVMNVMPGQTKCYDHPKITYNGMTQELFELEAPYFDKKFTFSYYTLYDASLEVWQSSPEFIIEWKQQSVTRPGKKEGGK